MIPHAIMGADPRCGEQLFDTPGADTFTVPPGVFKIHVVCVGAGGSATARGGGGGGGLAWTNDISVFPGQVYDINVGNGFLLPTGSLPNGQVSDPSWFGNPTRLCEAGGGAAMTFPGSLTFGGVGGTVIVGDGGGDGGRGGGNGTNMSGDAGSGGGAGGYTGNGGIGVNSSNPGGSGAGGAGGAGGCGGSGDNPAWGGGGVGVLGEGPSGAGGGLNQNGFGGSGGENGGAGDYRLGGIYGGGSAGADDNDTNVAFRGKQGAVRVIWGSGRSFPDDAAECVIPTFVDLSIAYGARAVWTFDNHDPSADVGGCLNANKLNCFIASQGGGQMWPAQILDSSGNNHTMLFRGALTSGGCSAGSGSNTRTGVGYSALMDYNGPDVACSAGGMTGFQNGFTMHGWLKQPSEGSSFAWCTSSGGGVFYWRIDTFGAYPADVRVQVRLADTTERTFTASNVFAGPSVGQVLTVAWSPVAGDETDCDIYLDGIPQVVTLNSPYTPQALDTGASVILFNSNGFTGPNSTYYDDAAVYPSRLTQAQIEKLVAAP